MGQVKWPGLGLPGLIKPILFSKLFFFYLKKLMFFLCFFPPNHYLYLYLD